jgi:hypothetical protein
MLTEILLAVIVVILALSIAQRESIARRQAASLKAHADAMWELQQTLNTFIDEIRSVQTYGLRLQK